MRGDAHADFFRGRVGAVERNLNAFVVEFGGREGGDVESPVNDDGGRGQFGRLSCRKQ